MNTIVMTATRTGDDTFALEIKDDQGNDLDCPRELATIIMVCAGLIGLPGVAAPMLNPKPRIVIGDDAVKP